jgi:hypothetical protein
MGILGWRFEVSRCRQFAGHSPFTYEYTLGSLQAEQALPMVFSSVEGHGVVTQRTPVSRVAQTGS